MHAAVERGPIHRQDGSHQNSTQVFPHHGDVAPLRPARVRTTLEFKFDARAADGEGANNFLWDTRVHRRLCPRENYI